MCTAPAMSTERGFMNDMATFRFIHSFVQSEFGTVYVYTVASLARMFRKIQSRFLFITCCRRARLWGMAARHDNS